MSSIDSCPAWNKETIFELRMQTLILNSFKQYDLGQIEWWTRQYLRSKIPQFVI